MTLEETLLEKWRVPFSTNRSKAEQFYEFVIHKISTGVFVPGEAVPPHRVIADLNGTHRNNAYRWLRKLVDLRWLCSKERGNYSIAHDPPVLLSNRVKPRLKEEFPFPIYPKHTLKYRDTIGGLDNFVTLFSDNIHYNVLPTEKYSKNVLRNSHLQLQPVGGIKIGAYNESDFKQATFEYLSKVKGIRFNIGQVEIIHDRLRMLNRVFGLILRPGDAVLSMVRADDELNEALCRANVDVFYLNPAVPNFIGNLEKLFKRIVLKSRIS